MAAALYLVSKTAPESPSERLIDGIHAMIINADDGHSAAEVRAHAVARAVALGHPLQTGYFDTTEALATLLDTDLDAIVVLGRQLHRSITP